MFCTNRGYGFVTPEEGSPDVFFHISALRGERKIEKGQLVTFDTVTDERTGRTKAAYVLPAEG